MSVPLLRIQIRESKPGENLERTNQPKIAEGYLNGDPGLLRALAQYLERNMVCV